MCFLYLQVLLENKSKFVLVHASSGFKHSLKGNVLLFCFTCILQIFIRVFFNAEVLQDPAIQGKLADTKAAGDVKALDMFYSMLSSEPDRAFYGKKHVLNAAKLEAIDKLLISDNLFR